MPKNGKPEAVPLQRPLRTLKLTGWFVTAGPFRDAPPIGMKNLCLQAEQPGSDKIDYRLPIQDFSTPDIRETVFALAWVIWQGVAWKRLVYIGCQGGKGRTGLVLALLVRIDRGTKGRAAVTYVRKHYDRHAVETEFQSKFVDKFPVRNLQRWVKVCRFIARINPAMLG